MKRSIKREHKERRNRRIFEDYSKLFTKGFRVDVIYQKLEDKYFLDQGTIYRIILEKKGVLEENNQIKDAT
jgi:hypothetical protein